MNENVHVVIIEDEKLAARMLHDMIKDLRPQWDITLLPGRVHDAVEWFGSHKHPDIIFLDIHLSDGNSFLFLEQAHPQSLIIFTTAYDKYAVQAFTVNSIDYLLKPIQKERLKEALLRYDRIAKLYSRTENEEILNVLQSLSKSEKKYRTRFLIAGTDKFFKLAVDDIAYFYTETRITFAVTFSGKEHIIDFTLDRLSEQLNPDQFFRANRHMILNIDSIQKIEPYFLNKIVVQVNPPFKEKVLVSRDKAGDFKMWLNY